MVPCATHGNGVRADLDKAAGQTCRVGRAKRVPPFLGNSWWDSLRSVMTQAMTYHSPPRHSTQHARRVGGPGSGAWEHGRSIRLGALEPMHWNNIRFCQRATLYGTEPCIFKVKTSRASNPHILECWTYSTLIVASFRRQYTIWYHFFVVQRGRWRQVTFLPEPEFAR